MCTGIGEAEPDEPESSERIIEPGTFKINGRTWLSLRESYHSLPYLRDQPHTRQVHELNLEPQSYPSICEEPVEY